MKIYKVDFDPIWPVPCGLIICAKTLEEAKFIATATVLHTDWKSIEEVSIEKSGVIFYESGDY